MARLSNQIRIILSFICVSFDVFLFLETEGGGVKEDKYGSRTENDCVLKWTKKKVCFDTACFVCWRWMKKG